MAPFEAETDHKPIIINIINIINNKITIHDDICDNYVMLTTVVGFSASKLGSNFHAHICKPVFAAKKYHIN